MDGGGRTRMVGDGTRDSASIPGEFEACSVQDCEGVLCFGEVSALGDDD